MKTNIREYGEGDPVTIERDENGRWVIVALNEARNNSTSVDLLDVIEWVGDLCASPDEARLLCSQCNERLNSTPHSQ